MIATSGITELIGRLHIVLLHLPIGFLMLLALLELMSMVPKWRHATLSNRFVLWLTAPITAVTAICGWLLAESGGYDERLLFLHRWTGVAVASAACLLLWIHCRGWISAYRVGILLTLGLMIYTGHLGGSLTHGRDFLVGPLSSLLGGNTESVAGLPSVPSSQDTPAFAQVEVVLNEYCVSCHGPEKAKGGLRVDSMESLLEGGDSGPVLERGRPENSLLATRMLLPMDDDEHMPPDGKPQPSTEDIKLIQDWIRNGATE